MDKEFEGTAVKEVTAHIDYSCTIIIKRDPGDATTEAIYQY
jgi:hypothetical protein